MAPSATVTAVSNVATAPATSDKDLALVARSAHLKPFGPFENLSAAMPWAVFPRKRLDLGFADVAVALSACLTLGEQHRAELTERIQRLWDPQGRAFVGLSVRTGFDLLLQSLKFPEGSEVLVSGVEIADMQYVMRYHGLVPVPVDVKPDTLGINVDLIESKITPKTKMILVAHIYGAFNSMDAVIAVARKHNLLVAEDCAQIYTSIKNYTGHPDSDVAMFSFGTVKTATALGGGILRVNDERVLAEMRERESHYESRTNGFFFKRAIKYGVLQSLTSPSNWGLFVRACHLFGHDHDDVITAAVRGFLGGELMTLLRKRPSLGLLALLEHRLKTSDEPYLALRKLKGQKLLSLLKDEPNIFVPGAAAENHVFWAFGVAVPDRQKVADYMNAQGFDVTAAATQLAYVNSPEGPDHDPFNAKRILTNVVYMPVTSETPDWAIEKMAKCLKEAVKGRRLGF